MKAPPLPTLRWSVGGILVLGMLTRVLGLVREMIVAGQFGTTLTLDAVLLGLSFPIALCLGVGGGLSRAMVPVGAALGRTQLGPLIVRGFRWMLLVFLPFSGLLALTAPLWASLLVQTGGPVDASDLRLIGAIACLALPGTALAGLFIGAANAHGRHHAASSSPVVYNLVIIITLVAGYRSLGAYSLLLGIVLAEWFQSLALLPFVLELREEFSAEAGGGEHWPEVLGLFFPAAILGASAGLMSTVDRVFAGGVGEGAVSTLSYAERILYLPVGMLGMALAQPFYTRLSRFVGEGLRAGYLSVLEMGVRLFLVAGAVGAVLVTALAEGIIALLLERGAFTPEDTLQTARALHGYGPAIVFLAMQPLLISAAMSVRRAWWVVAVTLFAVVVNGVLDAILVVPFGLIGITLSTSIVSGLMVLVLVQLAAPELLRRRSVHRCAAVAVAAAAVGVPAAWLFRTMFVYRAETFLGQLAWLAGGAAMILTCLLVLTGYFIHREWQSLRALRTTVARDAAALQRTDMSNDTSASTPPAAILAFGPGVWRFPRNHGSPRYHLWTLAGMGWPVLYVEPPWRITARSVIRSAEDRPLHVLSAAWLLPFVPRLAPRGPIGAAWHGLAGRILAARGTAAARQLGLSPGIYWFGAPWHASVERHLPSGVPRAAHIYDELAFSPAMPPAQGGQLWRWEQELLRRCDLALCSSEPQCDRRRGLARDTVLLENAIAETFLPESRPPLAEIGREILQRFRALPRPRCLYGGVADLRLDADYFVALLEQMTSGTLVLAGTVEDSLDVRLHDREPIDPRLHFLGPVPYEVYPWLYAEADCLVIAHKRNPFTDAMLPEKLGEYLASGKPIVAVPMPEIARIAAEAGHPDAIRLAENPGAFAEACLAATTRGEDSSLPQLRIELARGRTWTIAGQKLDAELRRLFQGKRSPH